MRVSAGAAELHRRAAAVRSRLWARLSDVLSYPSPELVEAAAGGGLLDELTKLAAALPYPLVVDEAAFAGTLDRVQIQSEYIRLFEVPVDGPTVPLYAGAYSSDRRQVMEELLRFYRHFGLSTAVAPTRDLPDSIPTVLEFLGYLAALEARAARPAAAATARAAQREVLERHLTRWTSATAGLLDARNPTPLYREAIRLLQELAERERAELSSR